MAGDAKVKRGPKPGPTALVNTAARIYLRHDEHNAAGTYAYIIAAYGSIQNYIRQHDPRNVVIEEVKEIADHEEIEVDDIDWSAMGI